MRLALTGLLLLTSIAARSAPELVLRGNTTPELKLSGWFGSLDALLSKADEGQALLAGAAPRPTVEDARAAAVLLQSVAKNYEAVTGDLAAKKEAVEFAASLQADFKDVSATEPLQRSYHDRVFALDKPSLNRWFELMRQQALSVPGPKVTRPANALVSLEDDSQVLSEAAFFSMTPANTLSPAIRALAASAGETVDSAVSSVVDGNRLWVSKQGATLYGDMASLGQGGLIRLRMQSPGGSAYEQSQFYFTTRALYELGFAVAVDNGVLTATHSGERARLDLDSRVEIFGAAWKAVSTGQALLPKLKGFLAGTINEEENAKRLDVLARIFAAEGRLPMISFDKFSAAVALYNKRDEEREKLRAQFSKTLEQLGLGSFPPDVPFGQRTIDLHYNAPLRGAIARGELVSDGKAYRKNTAYRARVTARPAPGYDWTAVYAAGIPAAQEGSKLLFRAQWRLDANEWLVVYFSRGLHTGEITGISSPGLDFAALSKKLTALGLLSKKTAPRVRESFGRRGTPDPTREAFGASLAPGSSVLARVTYDRSKAELGGRIFVTPYVGIGDRKAVSRSRGLLTTVGGVQAAIVAGLAGVPAVDLPSGVWGESLGLSIDLPVFDRSGAVVSFKRVVVREGEAVRLDPGRGVVSFPDPKAQSWLIAMQEALTAYDRGADINALGLWVRGRLDLLQGSRRTEMGRMLVAEMESRSKTGVSPEHLERIKRVVKSAQ